jgi:hypothetical protein
MKRPVSIPNAYVSGMVGWTGVRHPYLCLCVPPLPMIIGHAADMAVAGSGAGRQFELLPFGLSARSTLGRQ